MSGPEVIIVLSFMLKSSVITRCPLIPVFTVTSLATPQTLSVTGGIICPEKRSRDF